MKTAIARDEVVAPPLLMSPATSARTGWLLLRVVAALPTLWMLVFYSYVIRAWVALGRLPAPYSPDPKDLGMFAHHHYIGLFFEVALFTPAFLLVVGMLPGLREDRSRVYWFAGGLITYVVCAGLVVFDPGEFTAWYAD